LSYKCFVGLLLGSALVTLGLALHAWRFRDKAGARAFMGLALAMSIFSLTSGMSAFSSSPAEADFWFSKLRFVGISYVPVFFLIFVLTYSAKPARHLQTVICGLLGFPLLTLVFAFTNHYPGFFLHAVSYEQIDGLFFRSFWRPGPWFWVHTVFSYTAIASGLVLLGQMARYRPQPYKTQARLMLYGTLLPLLANLYATARLGNKPALDFTALGFTLSGLSIGFALFRHKMLDLVPIARDLVVECIDDAVIVLDRQLRVVDLNPAAITMFSASGTAKMGISINQLLPRPLDFTDMLREQESRKIEIDFPLPNGLKAVYELRISRFITPRGERLGFLLVARDVTERIDMIDERERIIQELEATKAELTRQANFDFLTEIFNRRHFMSLARNEFARARRYRHPLSLIMIDIDHFKKINDSFGHEAGDTVLREMALTIKDKLRQSDIPSRFGGEEFVILLPETSLEQALIVAEKIRLDLERLRLGAAAIRLTASLGVAGLENDIENLDELLRQADQAMYRAKREGRNRVCAAAPRNLKPPVQTD